MPFFQPHSCRAVFALNFLRALMPYSVVVFALAFWLLPTHSTWAQDEIYVVDPNTFSVLVYPRTANGATPPLRVVTGSATGLQQQQLVDIAVDAVHGEIYVLTIGSIVVHDRFANGNVSPRRTIGLVCTSSTALALDLAHDELVVAGQYCGIQVYARTAAGPTAPLRSISGPATQTDYLIGVAVDPVRNEIYVSDFISETVVVHSRTASGNAIPLRSRSCTSGGAPTCHGRLAFDTVNQELFAVALINGSVQILNPSLNVIRGIGGPATGLRVPNGVAVDTVNNEMLIADGGLASDGTISVFGRADQGNVSPRRRILSGPVSQFVRPVAVALAAGASQPALQATAMVNQSTFAVGQTLTASMTLNNQGRSGSADLYLGVLVPDGSTIVFWTGDGSTALGRLADLRTFRPYAANMSLTAPFTKNMSSFLSYQWTGAEPHGTYVLFNLATRAGALATGSAGTDDIVGLATASFTFNPGPSSPGWTRITPATPNGFPRGSLGSQSTAYDTANDRLIVFGGFADPLNPCCGESQDTWVLSNATGTGGTPTWTKLVPTGPLPPGRRQHSAVYDSVTNRMIIFGGGQFNGGIFNPLFNDVWVLKNANGLTGTPAWMQLAAAGASPAPREGHASVYNPATRNMVIFGGGNNGIMNVPNDLRILTNANQDAGAQWMTLAQSGDIPPPIEHFAAAYDPATDALVIAGGCCPYTNATRVLTHATGSAAPSRWMNLAPGGPLPPVGDQAHFGYDQGSNRLITQGPVPGGASNATWLLRDAISTTPMWSNSISENTPGSPPVDGTVHTGSAYNAALKKFVLPLYRALPGNLLVPEVWVLSNADQP